MYTDIFGSFGSWYELIVQIAALMAIAASIVAWFFIYRKSKLSLKPYVVPIGLWILFGTLDVLLTSRTIVLDRIYSAEPPYNLIVIALTTASLIGVVSVAWISFWSWIVLVVNTSLKKISWAVFISLAIFYSLALGHLFSLSSQFAPLYQFYEMFWGLLPEWMNALVAGASPALAMAILAGCVLAVLHIGVEKAIKQVKGV
jgi:hypothetical protein